MKAPGDDREELSEAAVRFEQRARALLRESVEGLPAQTRSRLTRARYAALASRPTWSGSLARRWLPAGALAAGVLAVLFVIPHGPHGDNVAAYPLASVTPEDIELLSDSDAVQLGRDDDVDYDFYEWAAGEAKGVNGPSLGS